MGKKSPRQSEPLFTRHPNVVFGCQGTRTRRGPVVVCSGSCRIPGIGPEPRPA